MIGAWKELKRIKGYRFTDARDQLIDKMAEYQGYTGTSNDCL